MIACSLILMDKKKFLKRSQRLFKAHWMGLMLAFLLMVKRDQAKLTPCRARVETKVLFPDQSLWSLMRLKNDLRAFWMLKCQSAALKFTLRQSEICSCLKTHKFNWWRISLNGSQALYKLNLHKMSKFCWRKLTKTGQLRLPIWTRRAVEAIVFIS